MLTRAMRVAELSTCKQRHGAVIVKGGRVISVGINTMRNDPDKVEDARTQSSVHAEVAAIRAVGHDVNLKGAEIYIARVSKKGEPMMSGPCDNCQDALRSAGIRKVHYTIDSEIELW